MIFVNKLPFFILLALWISLVAKMESNYKIWSGS